MLLDRDTKAALLTMKSIAMEDTIFYQVLNMRVTGAVE